MLTSQFRRLIFCSCSVMFITVQCFGQKPAVDTSVFDKWHHVGYRAISSYGNYVCYSIPYKMSHPLVEEEILVLQSTSKQFKKEYPDASAGIFSNDEKYFLFKQGKDSLCILNLTKLTKDYLHNVSSFKFVMVDRTEWLVYRKNDAPERLYLYNIDTKETKTINDVQDYLMMKNGTELIVQSSDAQQKKIIRSINLITGSDIIIWTTDDRQTYNTRLILNDSRTSFAFIQRSAANGKEINSVCLYKSGTNRVELLFNDSGEKDGLTLDDIIGFSTNNNVLFFRFNKKIDNYHPDSGKVSLDIWSYFDPKLQSLQLKERDTERSITLSADIDMRTRRITLLGKESYNTSGYGLSGDNIITYGNDYVIISRIGEGDWDTEWNWNKTALVTVLLVSTKDGTEKVIKENQVHDVSSSFKMSPNEKFIFWYDPSQKNYFSYEIATSHIRNITKNIPATWTSYYHRDVPRNQLYTTMGIGGYVNDGSEVLIYDQADLWQIDLYGKKPPINLTHGYGMKQNIAFKLLNAIDRNIIYTLNIKYKEYKDGDTVILTAYDRNTKDNGFFKIVIGKSMQPQLLSLQPYIIRGTEEGAWNVINEPLKAVNANKYIVIKQRASESPNLFYTKDFKTYKQLSFVYPEKSYNWLTTELVNYTTLDGKPCQGILYKPENFDSTKKYPIIFYYYEQLSDELNKYLDTEPSTGQMNIPYFVSNGYLVFVPDIHFAIGEWGESVYNSVIAAANYLIQRCYVNKKKMGLQGHSRGGYETSYLVTRTNMFAAAMAASGWSDLVNTYDGVRPNGHSRQFEYEIWLHRMNATLWERPDLYINNSPIFNADKITTPLLMMNNISDPDVFFENGVELFTALRRMGKKVWMLQYDNEEHWLWKSKAAELDLTMRMKQFFDHYLMDKPAPKWMVEGIPANKKAIDDGLELEPAGVEPPANLLIPEQQKIVDSLTNAPRFLVPQS